MTEKQNITKIIKNRNMAIGTRPRKKKKDSLIIRLWLHILLLIACLSIFSISYLYLGFRQTQIEYEISRLKRQQMRLQELNRKLRLEISVLKSPQRLEKIGKERFGLRHPTQQQIITIK